MFTRTHRTTVIFNKPFFLKGVDRVFPPGEYQVVTDEELIDGLSFPVFRRVSTLIFVPAQSRHTSSSSIEMITIRPRDLQAAQDLDNATDTTLVAKATPPWSSLS